MITEDYVSFEVAKLLKEKEFDECCGAFITPNIDFALESDGRVFNHILLDNEYAAPTLQMTMKWLREMHYYHIMIDCLSSKNYLPTIQQTNSSKDYKVEGNESKIMGNGFNSYEEAAEAAIKYCLMNLI